MVPSCTTYMVRTNVFFFIQFFKNTYRIICYFVSTIFHLSEYSPRFIFSICLNFFFFFLHSDFSCKLYSQAVHLIMVNLFTQTILNSASILCKAHNENTQRRAFAAIGTNFSRRSFQLAFVPFTVLYFLCHTNDYLYSICFLVRLLYFL